MDLVVAAVVSAAEHVHGGRCFLDLLFFLFLFFRGGSSAASSCTMQGETRKN